ncbi:hypothetical protein ACFOLF_06170 [Paenibacillus sepulcri]|uniref:Uncharacterized protein n=1 Tax=Paenibacillus sepulcri TaxID=359917 RepID=A0ABS7BX81_9BACL|nr:hypothetical protein [Paenibacillus sepulcri]
MGFTSTEKLQVKVALEGRANDLLKWIEHYEKTGDDLGMKLYEKYLADTLSSIEKIWSA